MQILPIRTWHLKASRLWTSFAWFQKPNSCTKQNTARTHRYVLCPRNITVKILCCVGWRQSFFSPLSFFQFRITTTNLSFFHEGDFGTQSARSSAMNSQKVITDFMISGMSSSRTGFHGFLIAEPDITWNIYKGSCTQFAQVSILSEKIVFPHALQSGIHGTTAYKTAGIQWETLQVCSLLVCSRCACAREKPSLAQPDPRWISLHHWCGTTAGTRIVKVGQMESCPWERFSSGHTFQVFLVQLCKQGKFTAFTYIQFQSAAAGLCLQYGPVYPCLFLVCSMFSF